MATHKHHADCRLSIIYYLEAKKCGTKTELQATCLLYANNFTPDNFEIAIEELLAEKVITAGEYNGYELVNWQDPSL